MEASILTYESRLHFPRNGWVSRQTDSQINRRTGYVDKERGRIGGESSCVLIKTYKIALCTTPSLAADSASSRL